MKTIMKENATWSSLGKKTFKACSVTKALAFMVGRQTSRSSTNALRYVLPLHSSMYSTTITLIASKFLSQLLPRCPESQLGTSYKASLR